MIDHGEREDEYTDAFAAGARVPVGPVLVRSEGWGVMAVAALIRLGVSAL